MASEHRNREWREREPKGLKRTKSPLEPQHIHIVGDQYDDSPVLAAIPDEGTVAGPIPRGPPVSPARLRDLIRAPSGIHSPSNTSIVPNQGDEDSSINAKIRSISDGEGVTSDFRGIRIQDPQSPSSTGPGASSPRPPLPRKRPSQSTLPEGDERAAKVHARVRSGPEAIGSRHSGQHLQHSRLYDPVRDKPSVQLAPGHASVIKGTSAADSQQSPRSIPQTSTVLENTSALTSEPADGTTVASEMGPCEAIFKQPPTRPITQEQLINEVKGIYAGLVMVEKKCVEIDQQQACSTSKLSGEQYQALIALHRTLLHEHHDFFLASQHPSASPALKKLATKYAMPARMWRHGIHSFLELLRHRLPDSLEHMLAFVYLAYSMMALLKDSVPFFEETWIECLGDLARYRMAIEESDIRDREIWSGVARMWYNRAADRSPDVGRIQHHLAVLARPNIVQQLFYYSKALTTVTPFYNAKESVMLLFNQFLEPNETASQRYPMFEATFVKAHGLLFVRGSVTEFDDLAESFTTVLEPYVSRSTSRFVVQGPEMASALCAAILDFGNQESNLGKLFSRYSELKPAGSHIENTMPDTVAMQRYWMEHRQQLSPLEEASAQLQERTAAGKFTRSSEVSDRALTFAGMTMDVIFSRFTDRAILPFAHVMLAFIWSLAFVPGALEYVQPSVPWEKVANFLNSLGVHGAVRAEKPQVGRAVAAAARHLPEDFIMRGLLWAQYYYPHGYFSVPLVEEDERNLELPSYNVYRSERCLWLGIQLSTLQHWLHYDEDTKQFNVTDFGKSVSSQFREDSDSRSSTEPLERDLDMAE